MGQITRILIVLISIWVVLRLAKAWLRMKSRPAAPARPAAIAPMERCAHCGVFQPRSEGLEINGRFYCSAEHARLGPRPS